MSCECWNSITLYGSAAEIERFRRMCIALPPGSEPQAVGNGWDGYEVTLGYGSNVPAGHESVPRRGTIVYASNYRERAPEPGSWWFAFDSDVDFPEALFEELATLFPKPHFDCDCIRSQDLMGYGWFNLPPGGEPFRQDIRVPRNYWTVLRCKRSPTAEAKYVALVAALARAAEQADRGLGDP